MMMNPSGFSREAFSTYTFESNEQQTLATALLPCSPLSSIHRSTASIPPFSAMDLHISSCNTKYSTEITQDNVYLCKCFNLTMLRSLTQHIKSINIKNLRVEKDKA